MKLAGFKGYADLVSTKSEEIFEKTKNPKTSLDFYGRHAMKLRKQLEDIHDKDPMGEKEALIAEGAEVFFGMLGKLAPAYASAGMAYEGPAGEEFKKRSIELYAMLGVSSNKSPEPEN